jgi:hypothetical protein
MILKVGDYQGVPFGYNFGVNTHFHVDLLIVYVYYSMKP